MCHWLVYRVSHLNASVCQKRCCQVDQEHQKHQEPITSTLVNHHCSVCIKFKLAVSTYHCFHGVASQYLTDDIHLIFYIPLTHVLTTEISSSRNQLRNQLVIKPTCLSTGGDKAFSSADLVIPGFGLGLGHTTLLTITLNLTISLTCIRFIHDVLHVNIYLYLHLHLTATLTPTPIYFLNLYLYCKLVQIQKYQTANKVDMNYLIIISLPVWIALSHIDVQTT